MNRTHEADPEVMAQQLGETLVLLNLRTDKFYELNRTAARAWELLGSGLNAETVADRMTGEFEVSRERAREEVEDVSAIFVRAGLLR